MTVMRYGNCNVRTWLWTGRGNFVAYIPRRRNKHHTARPLRHDTPKAVLRLAGDVGQILVRSREEILGA